jgi:hypothetical protein
MSKQEIYTIAYYKNGSLKVVRYSSEQKAIAAANEVFNATGIFVGVEQES